jgi:hypothetical protein
MSKKTKKSVSRKPSTVARKAKTRKIPPKKAPAAPKRPKPVLDPAHVAAWRMRRQGLEDPVLRVPENTASAVARHGWLNSPSGSTPYLALAARFASFTRHDLDRCIFEEGTLVEIPSVRGATMVVPVDEAWLALQAYQPRNRARVRDLLGRHRLLTRAALQNLEDVVRAVLAGRALPVDALREKIPGRLVKPLGPAGEAYGMPTSVDLALWDLVATGDVICRQVERRLDRSRYEYILRRDLNGPVVSAIFRPRPEDEFVRALAQRYFSWAGAARLTDFAWWADIPPTDARQGIRDLPLARVLLDGLKGDWLLNEADLEDLLAFRPPDPPGAAMVPFRDTLTASWKSFEGLVDPRDLRQPVMEWDGRALPALHAGPSATHHHFVVIAGRVAGAWEHGPDGVLRYATFRDLSLVIEPIVDIRAAAMAEFVRRELGEARFYAGGRGHGPSLAEAARDWAGRTARIHPRV